MLPTLKTLLLLTMLPIFGEALQALSHPVAVTVLPAAPLIERGRGLQLLNFDLVLRNPGTSKLTLSAIEVSVLSPGGVLLSQRRLDQDSDVLLTLPRREIAPRGTLVLFNPFYAFDGDLDLGTLRYELVLEAPRGAAQQRARIEVHPVPYVQRTELELPVRGRVLVHDGHDFYSHHRRLDVTGEFTTALGIKTNLQRYAYDLCVIDEQGRLFRGTGEANEDWFGFGAPVYAPGDGRVVAAVADRPDNSRSKAAQLTKEEILKDLRVIYGNYVILDHLNGEFSLLGHMKQGSVTVKAGQRVKRGEQIGSMGFSGDAFLAHLHYQLQRDSGFGEGLPSYFRGVRRVVGGKAGAVEPAQQQPAQAIQIDSGDVVESGPPKS